MNPNGRHELYMDRCCRGHCKVRSLAMTKLRFERNPTTRDIQVICPTCGRKSEDYRMDRIESDFDDIIYDIWRGLWECPFNRNACRVDCVHFVKPHIIETPTEKIIDLKFCGLEATKLTD